MSGWSNPAKSGTEIEPVAIDPWFFEHETVDELVKPVAVSIKGADELVPEAALRSIVIAAGPEGIAPRDALAEMARRGFVYRAKGKRVCAMRRRAGVSTNVGRGARWVVRS